MSLHVELNEGVLHLTIDRPRAKNAIDDELALAIEQACDRATRDDQVKSVLLTATGDIFLSGGDLRALARLPTDVRGAQAVIALGVRLAAIERCAVPVIAAVQGPVYGGGCELLVMTDVAIVDEAATLHFVHRKMGLVPAWGGGTRLVERVGAARAADILFTARSVSAAEAVAMGLVSRVVAGGTAEVEAGAYASEIARSSRQSLIALKRSLAAARHPERTHMMELEHKVFREAWGSAPHQDAMARFLKR